ncbi:MAG: carboxylating nicotinate-nucleotide diphosphorylase [Phycisphaerales bacterium]
MTQEPPSSGPAAEYERVAATGLVRRLLELARDEDLGPNDEDLTASVLGEQPGEVSAVVRAREPGVAAGLAAVPELLDVFGAELEAEMLTADGLSFGAGDALLRLRGSAADCVRIERTLLNLISRLSGIATRTAAFVERIAGRAQLLDTRKTTPGLRVLEKYAVRCGGGAPHRLGLYDAVMVKDNHLAALGGIGRAGLLDRLRDRPAGAAFVELEVDTLEQLERALLWPAGTVDFVLLDNMLPDRLRAAVAMRDAAGSSIQLEASGGVTLETVSAIASTGVERISVGSLTHRARSIDLGLDAEPAGGAAR